MALARAVAAERVGVLSQAVATRYFLRAAARRRRAGLSDVRGEIRRLEPAVALVRGGLDVARPRHRRRGAVDTTVVWAGTSDRSACGAHRKRPRAGRRDARVASIDVAPGRAHLRRGRAAHRAVAGRTAHARGLRRACRPRANYGEPLGAFAAQARSRGAMVLLCDDAATVFRGRR